MSKLQAIFLDRDGTLGGTGHFIHPRDFTLFPFAAEAIALLKAEGIRLFAFTNQHRISLGEATEAEFAAQFAAFGLDGAYICPHAADAGCACRKPAPGMLLRAAAEHGLDLTRCAVVGDVGATDMLAAHAVGAVKVLVRTGWGEGSLGPYRETWAGVEPDYVADHLLDAARWLISVHRSDPPCES
ncbi:MAG: HAD-IIIA family hydrolase [Bacillota bacterium]